MIMAFMVVILTVLGFMIIAQHSKTTPRPVIDRQDEELYDTLLEPEYLVQEPAEKETA